MRLRRDEKLLFVCLFVRSRQWVQFRVSQQINGADVWKRPDSFCPASRLSKRIPDADPYDSKQADGNMSSAKSKWRGFA